MIDLRAIAVRLRDEAEKRVDRSEPGSQVRRQWITHGISACRDIATLDGIARAVTEAREG